LGWFTINKLAKKGNIIMPIVNSTDPLVITSDIIDSDGYELSLGGVVTVDAIEGADGGFFDVELHTRFFPTSPNSGRVDFISGTTLLTGAPDSSYGLGTPDRKLQMVTIGETTGLTLTTSVAAQTVNFSGANSALQITGGNIIDANLTTSTDNTGIFGTFGSVTVTGSIGETSLWLTSVTLSGAFGTNITNVHGSLFSRNVTFETSDTTLIIGQETQAGPLSFFANVTTNTDRTGELIFNQGTTISGNIGESDMALQEVRFVEGDSSHSQSIYADFIQIQDGASLTHDGLLQASKVTVDNGAALIISGEDNDLQISGDFVLSGHASIGKNQINVDDFTSIGNGASLDLSLNTKGESVGITTGSVNLFGNSTIHLDVQDGDRTQSLSSEGIFTIIDADTASISGSAGNITVEDNYDFFDFKVLTNGSDIQLSVFVADDVQQVDGTNSPDFLMSFDHSKKAVFESGLGNDFIYSGYNRDHITLNGGNNIVYDLGGENVVRSLGGGNDIIYTISGGRDIIDVHGGSNIIRSDGGNDEVSLIGVGDNTVELGSGADQLESITVSGNLFVNAGSGNDTINHTGVGNGKDVIMAGRGNDVVNLTAGSFDASMFVDAGQGNDHIVVLGLADATINANQGRNFVFTSNGDDKVATVGSFDQDGVYTAVDPVATSVDKTSNLVVTGVGDDMIYAKEGDTILSGSGNDQVFIYNTDTDTAIDSETITHVSTGAGNDVITINQLEELGLGTNQLLLNGGTGEDQFVFTGNIDTDFQGQRIIENFETDHDSLDFSNISGLLGSLVIDWSVNEDGNTDIALSDSAVAGPVDTVYLTLIGEYDQEDVTII